MVQREYEFNYGEPGLFMEIYVAKKAEFQPLLYETLTAGFNLKKVRSHFRSKAEAIRRFMRRNRQLHDFSSYRINHFGNVFTGYSLYEVDGTFDGGAQERTQVVRVIFVPPLAEFSKGLKIPRVVAWLTQATFSGSGLTTPTATTPIAMPLYPLSLANVTSFGSSRDGLTTWGFSRRVIFSMRSAPALVNSTGMGLFASPRKSSG
jgi:hypothetical protein